MSADISSTDLAYMLGLAETAANNLRDELRNELADLDLDAGSLILGYAA